FEEGLSNWSTWKGSGEFTVETDKTNKSEGTTSIKIYSKDGKTAKGTVTQNIDATGLIGKAVKIKQSVKSLNLNGAVRLRAKYMDSNWNQVGELDVKTLDIKGTTDWGVQEYTIEVPDDS
uniref:hypothetical protein n=1 Tax=Acinetobacter baumannii TaxID=470 RepID=UPI0018673661